MTNYHYKLRGFECTLDQLEHDKCLDGMTNGKPIVLLRNGSLIIDTRDIKLVHPTAELTSAQTDEKTHRLTLSEPTTTVKKELSQIVLEGKRKLYEKMGWPIKK